MKELDFYPPCVDIPGCLPFIRIPNKKTLMIGDEPEKLMIKQWFFANH
jgi:hypothetical protein